MTVTPTPGNPPFQDLGALRGPVLLFGGPYSNLQALQALLAEADRLGIPAGNMICSGDVVAYCADPQATVDLMRQRGIVSVMGNCEENLGSGGDDCGCGFAPGTACDLASVAWYRYADGHLDESARAWMRRCPRHLRFGLNGLSFRVVHGAPEAVSEFIFASDDQRRKSRALQGYGEDVLVAGHCGQPFVQPVGNRLWLNAGVIGVPANDGTPRVWYALIEGRAGGIRVQLKSLHYDHQAAAAAMARAGLPEGYARALTSGLWPSLDVLPAAERAATGQPLAETSVDFRTATARAAAG